MATWKKLAYEDDVVTKALYDANTILKADSDNTPVALTVGESTIVGRAAGSSIAALSPTAVRSMLNVEDGADVTDTTNVAAAGAVMESDYTAKGVLIAGTGAGTAGAVPSAASNGLVLTSDDSEATGMKWSAVGGTGDFKADGTVAMTGNLSFAGVQARDMVFHLVSNAAALSSVTAVVGKGAFLVDVLAPYICTAL